MNEILIAFALVGLLILVIFIMSVFACGLYYIFFHKCNDSKQKLDDGEKD